MGDRSQPVFIGPVCVGKTSVSLRVAEILGLQRVELDEIAGRYYRDCPDFDSEIYNTLLASDGFVAAYRYWEPALAYAVDRVVDDFPTVLLDLGAGHTSFLDRRFHEAVEAALAPYRNIVLLLPDVDPDRSVSVIRHRLMHDSERPAMSWEFPEVDFIRHWVEDDQNRRLAEHVAYTGDADPGSIATQLSVSLG